MSDKIIVTPKLLEDRSRECEKYAKEVEEIHKELKKLADNLEAEWKGNASREFLSQFKDIVLPNFETAIKLLAEEKTGAAAELKKAAANFSTADGKK